MRHWWLCILAFVSTTGALAFQKQATIVPLADGNPSLIAYSAGIRDATHRRALPLDRFDLALNVRGRIATGVVTARFAGSGNERLEADFRLALPKGAVVTGYALDVDGKMIDGVLVDRPRAKAVYEARVRQRVDPGLAEVASDGTFATRVFPVGPTGRTIRVAFTVPVGRAGLRLPLKLDAPARGWAVDVQASGLAAEPRIGLPGQRAVRTKQDAGAYHAHAEGSDALAGDLTVAAPASLPVVISRHSTGERYLQLTGRLGSATAAKPDRIRIYWDRSRSRLNDALGAEAEVVRRLLEQWRPGVIEIVAFNSSAPQRQAVRDGVEAEQFLSRISYRGATSFAGLDSGPADRCLLVSDGHVTIDRAAEFNPACPLDVLTSSAMADSGYLRHLAAAHGGRLVALRGVEPAVVADDLARPSAAVASVRSEQGRALPFLPMEAPEGQWAILVRAPAVGAVLVRTTVADEARFAVPDNDTPFDGEGALLARDLLSQLGATEQRAAFVATSRRYGIASPSLSFLVLESPQDYLQAEVTPPASYPAEQRAVYLSLKKQSDRDMAARRRARMDVVVRDWQDQVSWWQRRFNPKAVPKRASAGDDANLREVDAPAMVVPAPPPPPPPPPPQPAPAQAIESDSASIIVTSSREADPRERQRARGNAPERQERPEASVVIDAWQPDRPYLAVFDAAPERFENLFPAQERKYGSLPAFYLDVADWLQRRGRTAEAAEMVMGALELDSANEVTLGIVAGRLERYGAIDRAIELRERHAVLDPDRPQPKRLLALTLAKHAALRPAAARADLARAIVLLNEIATEPLDPRWRGIDMIALMEANALVPKFEKLGGEPALDPRLVQLLDADVRVVVDWTTDATDLDLWVDEPNRERAIYSNPRTAAGGHLSDDMTQGYGPEEYWIRRAQPGGYKVQANVYSADRLDPNGASLITARLIRNFGRANEQEETVDIELVDDGQGQKSIGTIIIPPRR